MIPDRATLRWRDGHYGEALSWVGATLVVLGVYAGIIAWFLIDPLVVVAENAPPPAIMVDLAMEDQAQETETDDITPDRETSEASHAIKEIKAPDQPLPDTPEDVSEEVPFVEEPAETEEIIEEPLRLHENVAVPLPQARPEPPVKKSQETSNKKKKKTRPQKQTAASAAKVKAKAKVLRSQRTAARRWSSGGASSLSPAKWTSRLLAHLERRKRYPAGSKSRREQGTAYVRFKIDEAGVVLSVRLARSSGFQALDSEVVAMVKRASPVPAPPPNVKRTLTVPVNFRVK
ncbi:energy transducer TonB [Roseibium algae]|uniref:Energy transducer TonB n=1 Tax=Roseibium algae TaxID=3123038 RepID=A0ABU8TEA2_9HYPH